MKKLEIGTNLSAPNVTSFLHDSPFSQFSSLNSCFHGYHESSIFPFSCQWVDHTIYDVFSSASVSWKLENVKNGKKKSVVMEGFLHCIYLLFRKVPHTLAFCLLQDAFDCYLLAHLLVLILASFNSSLAEKSVWYKLILDGNRRQDGELSRKFLCKVIKMFTRHLKQNLSV